MGAQALKPCGGCANRSATSVADDVIETCSDLPHQTDERRGLGQSSRQGGPCSDWDAPHRDRVVNLMAPAWCSECGALLVGVLQQALRCTVCKRLACEHCAQQQPCLAGSLLNFISAGGSAQQLPPTIHVLCMDMGLILLLAHDHPEAVAYSAEVLWRNPAFLRGLVALVDGTESPPLRSVVAKQLAACKKTERDVGLQVLSAILQEAEVTDLALDFAMELLANEAEQSTRALAMVKEFLKHSRACVRAAAVKALGRLAPLCAQQSQQVLARLRDPEPVVRSAVALVLPKLSLEDRVKLGSLTTCLQDSEAAVRQAAVISLPLCGVEVESRSRSAMSNALLDRDGEVRERGWTSLRALSDASQAKILVGLARSHRLDDLTRRRLVESLRALLRPGTPQAIGVTASALAGASWWLRLAMCDCFYEHLNASELEVRCVSVLAVDSLADRTDTKAAAALAAKLKDPESSVAQSAWTAIRKRLEDADVDVNRVWLEELRCEELNEEIRGEVICLVLRNLIDSNWLIQMAATRALQLRVPAEAGEVMTALEGFREDLEPSIRSTALELFEHFSGQEGDAEDSICKALSSKSF